ncbi:MAG TPA: alpha/beta hydrolase [Steroidobacteraceae bacterium]|nr:alpha/beta hydrolase [Steroidobacteraceae bacterium]
MARFGSLKPAAWLGVLLVLAHDPALTVGAGAGSAAVAKVEAEGTVEVPATSVPLSTFMSAAARKRFIELFAHPQQSPAPGADIRIVRELDEQKNAPLVARARELYPVDIERRVMGGVSVQVITPKAGVAPENRKRVLINLHGGGFQWGENHGAQAESIPIAGLGRITVIAVAYRMAPEFKFPAASEDVAAVYRELLESHQPGEIGIYGCSSGGVLTAESIAWFRKVKLPLPGAIGTFCGSAAEIAGDSRYVAPLLTGGRPPRSAPGAMSAPYFSDASPEDPLVLPTRSPELLAAFPPTLLIAGSRDHTVSSLFATQAALARAGVEAELHVWDGMWHAFFFDPDLPESQEVYRVIVRFFDRHLARS